MTDVRVTLRDESRFWVTVDLSVVKSTELKVKSRLAEASERLKLPDGSEVSLIAAEAACFSGAFFGLRHIGGEGDAIAINDAFGELETGDLTICAVAVCVGVQYAICGKETMADEVPNGWRLMECTERGKL